MAVEIAAQHFTVFRPTCKRDGGAMNADEALAIVTNERKQIRLLRGIHVEVAVGEENDGVVGVQIFRLPLERLLRDGRAVGPKLRIPNSGTATQIVKRRHGRGDGFVLIALSLPDEE